MRFLVFTVVFLFSSPLDEQMHREGLIVWNVGQGQFVTWYTPQTCYHFDSGGEDFPRAVIKLCQNKKNEAYFSHWDQDHIGFAQKLFRMLASYCISDAPPFSKQTPRGWQRLPVCSMSVIEQFQRWAPSLRRAQHNDLSRVWVVRKFALIPGDSPQRAEQIWSKHLPVASTFVMLLGHHGSRTSTSTQLLRHLLHARMAIASARWARYHHPHSQTVARLNKHGIALLKTEDWGSIWIEAPHRHGEL